jgi:hypothetical protein
MTGHVPAFDQLTLGDLNFLGLYACSAAAQDGSLERAWRNYPGKQFPKGSFIHPVSTQTA